VKRFWEDVSIADGEVALDGRPVRTPGRVALRLPTAALAEAVAEEWRAVGERVDPRTMPLTGLANAAIDRIAPAPQGYAETLARYGESDLLCYRAESPPELVARQAAAWDPPLAWAMRRYDAHFEIATGIIHVAQPPATLARLHEAVAALDAWTITGLTPLVTVTGSLVLGLALVEGAMDADSVWHAARIDDDWQVERWGEDELATRTTEAHRAEFDAAVRFLAALRG